MNFKGYVTSILYVAIFAIILELFLPKTKLKKYISSFMSLLVIFTIISPIFNVLKEKKVEQALDNALLAISNNISITSDNDLDFDKFMNTTIVSRVRENLEQELYKRFSERLKDVTDVETVEITLDEKYNLKEVIVYVDRGDFTTIKVIIDRIISEYEIPSSILKVVKKGE